MLRGAFARVCGFVIQQRQSEIICLMTIRMKDLSKSRALKNIEQDLAQAHSYPQWLALAAKHDRETGADVWRQQIESNLYDYSNLKIRLNTLRSLRRQKDDHGLLFVLNEGIHGNMAGMGKSMLYQHAKSGTKTLIEEYINEVSEVLKYLSPRDMQSIPWAERIEFFQRASHCYGRSALMLSGGGTLGYFHFGVLKALIEQELCPVVISGASAGAFVASIVGTRTDEEYLALFENNYLARELTVNRGDIKIGFGQNKIDMEAIEREMARMIPDMTFLEAYEKTGRSINITISPAEPRQESRLLNHIASPNVTIRSAVLASTSLPGVFPPVQLQARNVDGEVQPYLPSRRWIDGTFSQDLPAKRLARMYGVNHFIVSQVMPGLGREPTLKPGIRKIMSDASVAATKELVRGYLDFLQRHARVGPKLSMGMTTLNALIDQRFTADINIFPDYGASSLSMILKMLSEEEMAQLIKAGERATWPKIPAIGTTTRIGYTLDRILHAFEVDEEHWLRTAPQSVAAGSVEVAVGEGA
jgi:TAG lipase/steryl ester hydrolase/phospholipase A2/LPA acyltransferase